MPKIHINQIDDTSFDARVNSLITIQTTGLATGIASLESDVETLIADVDIVSGEVLAQGTYIGDVSGRLDNFESDFYDFNSRLNTISGDLSSVEVLLSSTSGTLQGQIDNLDFGLSGVIDEINILDSGLSVATSSIASLSGVINDISGVTTSGISNKMDKTSNLSDITNKETAINNLNLQRQYLFLKADDFVTGTPSHAASYPLRLGFPTLGNTATTGGAVYSRIIGAGWGFSGRSELQTCFTLPGNWNKGRIYPKIYCTATGGASSDVDVMWHISAEFFDQGSDLTAQGGLPFFIKSTIPAIASNISGVLSIAPQGSGVSGMVLSGLNSGDSDFDKLVFLKIARSGALADDTLADTVTALLLGVGIEYAITGTSTPWAVDI